MLTNVTSAVQIKSWSFVSNHELLLMRMTTQKPSTNPKMDVEVSEELQLKTMMNLTLAPS